MRLDVDRRWPGVLQRVLGAGCDVIEEGLNGRSTNLDVPGRPGLAGRSYFVPCLLSHRALDVVIVMLGGNDLKPGYGRSPEEVADALGGHVDDTAPGYRDLVGDDLDPGHAARSRQLDNEVRRVAGQRGALYAAAAEVAGPGEDGIHLDMASQAAGRSVSTA